MDPRYQLVFTPCEEGGWFVWVPACPGCVSQGNTLEEAAAMIKEALEGWLVCMVEDGQTLPQPIPRGNADDAGREAYQLGIAASENPYSNCVPDPGGHVAACEHLWRKGWGELYVQEP